jgi:mevalonate kinase
MSENAKAVAKKVASKVRKGQKVVLGEIIKEQGYSESVSESPTKVTKTKAYKEEIQPIVDQLEKERQRIIKALKNKDLDEERYKDLVDGMDKITKNIQLLGNKPTEITKHQLTDDEMDEIDELLD